MAATISTGVVLDRLLFVAVFTGASVLPAIGIATLFTVKPLSRNSSEGSV